MTHLCYIMAQFLCAHVGRIRPTDVCLSIRPTDAKATSRVPQPEASVQLETEAPAEAQPPEEFLCPITHEIMEDRVFTMDGAYLRARAHRSVALCPWAPRPSRTCRSQIQCSSQIARCTARSRVSRQQRRGGDYDTPAAGRETPLL